jgi:putative addiction module component (TIGR02574 family)
MDRIMTTEVLKQQVLALPMQDRVEIVEAVWQTIEDRHPCDDLTESEIVAEALRRDAAMDADPSVKRTYEEVREAMRRPLK